MKALQNPDLTLTQLLDAGKVMEMSKSQADNTEGKQDVNKLSKKHNTRPISKPNKDGGHVDRKSSSSKSRDRNTTPGESRKCRNCGKWYPHPGGKTSCPAYGKSCRGCAKQNHFEAVCRSKNPNKRKDPKARKWDVQNLANQNKNSRLQVKRVPHSSWKITTVLKFKSACVKDKIYVVKGSSGSLLSWKTSQDLGLLKAVHHVHDSSSTRVEELVKEYDELFHGLGKLKGYQVKLHIDESVQPVAQPHRRVPFHVRQQLEEQLKRDEDLGVVERIEGPTPWVSPIVIAPKPNSPRQVRVCVDMRQANQAIKRERQVTPTIKEIIGDLNGAKVFSKLDLNKVQPTRVSAGITVHYYIWNAPWLDEIQKIELWHFKCSRNLSKRHLRNPKRHPGNP